MDMYIISQFVRANVQSKALLHIHCIFVFYKSEEESKMAQQIRITPQQMRQRSSEVRNQGETFQGVIGRMQSIINELQSEWEGQASRAFAEQFDRLRPAFNDMRQLIEDIGTQLNATADAVERLDQEIAGRFR
jgi:WXG100 family type VII secretion target